MKTSLAHTTVRTSAVLFLRLLAQAGTLVLVARLLGPSAYGAFAGAASLAVLLGSLSNFGTHLVLLREVSRDPDRRAAIAPFATLTTLVCGLVLLITFVGLATWVLHGISLELDIIFCLGLSEIVIQPLIALPAVEQQGQGRVASAQMILITPQLLRLLVAMGIWTWGSAQPLHAYSWGYLVVTLLALGNAWRVTGWGPISHAHWRFPDRNELSDAAGFAALNLTALGPSELDKTLALRLLPIASVGIYAAGTRIIGAMMLPMMAVTLAAMPRLFREATDPKPNWLVRTLFVLALGYGCAAAVLLWLCAPLLAHVFGSGYRDVGTALQWLTITIPGLSLRMAAGSTLMARGHPWVRATTELLGLCALAGTAVLFARGGGSLHGMALALACSEWSMAILGWLSVMRHATEAPQTNAQAVATVDLTEQTPTVRLRE